MHTLQIVDPFRWARESAPRLFGSVSVDAMALVPYIVLDVLEIGRGECRISNRETWWFVCSDVDWMKHETIGVAELFARIVPAPAHGMHSLRAELLLNTFATDVLTEGLGGPEFTKGDAPSQDLIRSAVDARWTQRFVAFRVT